MDPRAVKKLLDNLRNDPQLRTEDDPTIVAEEQYPMAHHPIFGACIEKNKIARDHHNVAMEERAQCA